MNARSDRLTIALAQLDPTVGDVTGLGGNGIAGVSCALAPSLNNRLYRVVTWYDLKAGHGWERWL